MEAKYWHQAIAECERQGDAYVIVTILGVKGSTPRNETSKMVVTGQESFDTIGGGQLEFQVIQHARELIAHREKGNFVEHFPLGASLGQCCGGSVSVLFESFSAQGINLTVFGAGHVAQALLKILESLPGHIRWVDSRKDQFPNSINGNVEILLLDDPVTIIDSLPSNSQILILTHNHQLDFQLAESALRRGDFSYIGCIGSKTKAQRFQHRLKQKSITQEQIDHFICPVGDLSIKGKLPMEVAVSIAAQLIQLNHLTAQETKAENGVSWQFIKQQLMKAPVQSHTVNRLD